MPVSAAVLMVDDTSSSASVVASTGPASVLMAGSSEMVSTVPAKGQTVRILVTTLVGVPICELPYAILSPITYQLNEPESFTVTMLQSQNFAEVLITPFREIQVWRGDQILAWGPIIRWAFDKNVVTVQCRGAMWHLSRRYIGKANRHNWVNNGSFEDGLDGWNFATNGFNNAYGLPHAQALGPSASSITFPKVEGRRAMSLENSVDGADAWADQSFAFTVEDALNPEGEIFTLKGYAYLPEVIPTGAGAFENRGLYLERFSTTQLDPRAEVQAVLPGSLLSLEHKFVKLDESTPVGVWQRFEIEVTSPPKNGEPEIINVRLYPPAGTPVYWDAVSLTRVEKLAFYGVDQASIADGIVHHLQQAIYDKSDVNITTNCPPTGVLRTKVYIHSEHPPGWAALQEFNAYDDGFDFRMVYTATDRIFTTSYPHFGVLKSNYPVRLPQWDPALPGNIAEWNVSFDGEQAASSVVVLGSGSGSDREEGGAVDASGWADGVTMEKVFTAPDGTSIDSLGAIANEQVRIGRNPITIEVTLFAAEPGGLPDLIGNVYPGDEVPVTIERHQLQIDDVYRVVRSEIDLTAGTMKLTLNPRITTA